MGMLDDAVGALDAVANAGGAGGPVSATPVFVRDEPLITKDADSGGAAGPDPDGSGKHNAVDTGIPTEFIHYGLVHADVGKKFVHKKFPPGPKPGDPPEGHAIMFRDALQREAILLHGFVSSTAVVLQEYLKDKGPVSAIGDAVGGLMGGGSSSKKPDPTQLDTIMSDIKSAIDPIKGDSIKYPDIHEAGKKLHQARANFNKFCDSLNDAYLKPPSGDGPAGALNAAMSAIPSIPGVGNTIQVVQRFLFKMFDIYLAVFLELRRSHDPQPVDDTKTSHERNIEHASHALTIDAIKTNYEKYEPTYPIWFKKTPPPEDDGSGSGGSDPLSKAADDVNKEIKDVKKKADDVKKDVYDFAGANQEPEETPGTPQISAVFLALKGSPKKDNAAPPAPPTAADATITALDTVLKDISGLPSFLHRPIEEVTKANVGLLEEVFKKLMAQEASAPIDNTMLLAAGRRYMTDMIAGIGVGLVSGMVPTSFQGLNIQDFISKELNQYLGKFIEPIVMLSIGDLAVALEQSRQKAQDEKAQTMEVYLGRLPWLTALMFRNTFFPIWNLLAEKVFGSVAGPLKSVMHGANEKLNAVRDKVDDAKHAQDTASKMADAAQNVDVDASQLGKAAQPFDQAKKDADADAAQRQAERDAEEKKKKAIDDFVDSDQFKKQTENFPVIGRTVEGQGIKVEAEIPSVIPEGASSSAGANAAPAGSPAPAASPAPAPPSVPGM
jgi:hypothetical protein